MSRRECPRHLSPVVLDLGITMSAMPKKDIVDEPDTEKNLGYLPGDNARRIGFAQRLLSDSLRLWFSSFGTAAEFEEKSSSYGGLVTKVVNCHTLLPADAPQRWSLLLGLASDERRALEYAAGLCATPLDALCFFDANWEASVAQLGKQLERFAKRREKARQSGPG